MTTLLTLEIKNFFKTEHALIQLANQGLVLLAGPIGAGKTTLVIEGVYYAIYGQSFEYGASPGDAVMSRGSKNMLVRLDMDTPSGLYRIVRCRGKVLKDDGKTHHRPGLSLFYVVDGVESDRTGDSPKSTQETINSLTGLNARVFCSSVMCSTEMLKFPDLPDTEKKRIIDQATGVDSYDAAFTVTKAKRSALEVSCGLQESLLHQERLQMQTLQRQLEQISASSAEWEEERKQLEEEHLNKERLKAERRDRLKNDITTLSDSLSKLRLTKIDLEHALEGAETTYKETLTKKPNNSASVAISARIHDLRQRIGNISTDDVCPTCGQGLPDAQGRLSALKILERDLEQLLKKHSVAVSSEKSSLQLWEVDNRKCASAVMADKQRVREANTKLEGVSSKLYTAKATLDEMDIVETKTITDNPYVLQENRVMDSIDTVLKSFSERREIVASLHEELDDELTMERLFSPKGCRIDVLNSILPSMNETAALVSAALETGIEVKFSLRDKDESKAGTIDIEVNNPDGAGQYHGNSGGERRIVDLIIFFCVTKITSVDNGFNQTFFDETFEKLDPDTQRSFLKAIKILYGDKSSNFIIAHAADGFQDVDQVWHIRNGSIQHIQKISNGNRLAA